MTHLTRVAVTSIVAQVMVGAAAIVVPLGGTTAGEAVFLLDRHIRLLAASAVSQVTSNHYVARDGASWACAYCPGRWPFPAPLPATAGPCVPRPVTTSGEAMVDQDDLAQQMDALRSYYARHPAPALDLSIDQQSGEMRGMEDDPMATRRKLAIEAFDQAPGLPYDGEGPDACARVATQVKESSLGAIMQAFMEGKEQGAGLYIWGLRAAFHAAGFEIVADDDE
jgi:hypothetical protein